MSEQVSASGSLEERLNFYANEALPNSIKNIAENSKNLTPVIEYLEQAYLTAPDQQAQDDVETQAKTYLVDALTTVVGDINSIADNMDHFVSLQADAVDSLGTQMDLLRTKMKLYKEQHGTKKLDSYRDPIRTTSGTYSRRIDGNDTSGSNAKLSSILLPSSLLFAEQSAEEEKGDQQNPNNEKRVPFNDRLARYDDVGICLDREDNKLSPNAAVVASSSVLRRSSYTKHNPHRRASQVAEDCDASVNENDDDTSVCSQGSRMVPPPRLSTVKH